MPHKKNQAIHDAEHSQQAGGAHAGASTIVDTGTDATLLAPRAAVAEITANISKVIAEKLSPLYIGRSHDKRITEAGQRISALEVCELSERADDFKFKRRTVFTFEANVRQGVL